MTYDPIARLLLACRDVDRWGRIMQETDRDHHRHADRARAFGRVLDELRDTLGDVETTQ